MTGSDGNQTDNYALVDDSPAQLRHRLRHRHRGRLKDTYALTTVTPPAGTPLRRHPLRLRPQTRHRRCPNADRIALRHDRTAQPGSSPHHRLHHLSPARAPPSTPTPASPGRKPASTLSKPAFNPPARSHRSTAMTMHTPVSDRIRGQRRRSAGVNQLGVHRALPGAPSPAVLRVKTGTGTLAATLGGIATSAAGVYNRRLARQIRGGFSLAPESGWQHWRSASASKWHPPNPRVRSTTSGADGSLS